MNRRHLERVLRVFADHYNSHRPHRSLDLKPPDPLARQLQILHSPTALVERRDRLGGLIHEYRADRANRVYVPHRPRPWAAPISLPLIGLPER